MTIAFALMNEHGIVLAADQAKKNQFDVQTGRVKKLFELSPQQPISFMVYNNYSYYNISFDTIIDLYRNDLQNSYYEFAHFYLQDFLDFLENRLSETYDLQNREEKCIDDFITEKVKQLSAKLNDMQNYFLHKHPTATEAEIDAAYFSHGDALLIYELKQLEQETLLEGFTKEDELALFEQYEHKINERIEETFPAVKEDWTYSIVAFVIQNMLKTLSNHAMGIVVAGYGEKELFPSVHRIEIDGKVNGKLRCKYADSYQVTPDNPAMYFSFMPLNKITQTLNGMSENIEHALYEQLQEKTEQIINDMLQKLFANNLDETIFPIINSEVQHLLYDIQHEFEKIKIEEYNKPLINFIQHRSIDELVHIARTLLHAELFGNHITAEVTEEDILFNIGWITKTNNVTLLRPNL